MVTEQAVPTGLTAGLGEKSNKQVYHFVFKG